MNRRASDLPSLTSLSYSDVGRYLRTLDEKYNHPLAVGREALALAYGDLQAAVRQQPELAADIVLAWLEREIDAIEVDGGESGFWERMRDLVTLAAEVLEDRG